MEKIEPCLFKFVFKFTLQEYADGLGIPFIETSAKDGTNVEEAFITLAAMVKNTVLNESQ